MVFIGFEYCNNSVLFPDVKDKAESIGAVAAVLVGRGG